MKKNKNIFVIIINLVGVLFFLNIVHTKIVWFYPNEERRVNTLDKNDNLVAYINDQRDNILDVEYYETLTNGNLFTAERNGYIINFIVLKNDYSYLCTISNSLKSEIVGELKGFEKENYKNYDIYIDWYHIDQGLVYYSASNIMLGDYVYRVNCKLLKEDCPNKEEAIQKTKQLSLTFAYELIDDYLSKNSY